MKLIEMIDWLTEMETLARKLYIEAAKSFEHEPDLAAFLCNMAKDEAQHIELMKKAHNSLVASGDDPESVLVVDEETKRDYEAPFQDALIKIEKDGLTIPQLLDAVVEIELSEWNDIFLYVINSCQPESKSFQHMAAIIQEHEDRIGQYLDSLPEEKKPSKHVRVLPKVWTRRFLVAEDEATIRELWKRILQRFYDAEVVTAEDGREALDAINSSYFDLIISDVEMPYIKGTELYERVIKDNEQLKDRFIFCTGFVTDEVKSVIEKGNVKLLEKPVSIQQVKETVNEILNIPTTS